MDMIIERKDAALKFLFQGKDGTTNMHIEYVLLEEPSVGEPDGGYEDVAQPYMDQHGVTFGLCPKRLESDGTVHYNEMMQNTIATVDYIDKELDYHNKNILQVNIREDREARFVHTWLKRGLPSDRFGYDILLVSAWEQVWVRGRKKRLS
jgi:hypothetical protein